MKLKEKVKKGISVSKNREILRLKTKIVKLETKIESEYYVL